MTEDATPLTAAGLQARPVKPAKPTLVPLLITVAIATTASLLLAIRGNPVVLGEAPAQAGLAYAETVAAHLRGGLAVQAVISVLIGLVGWAALYFSVVRRQDKSRGASHMATLVVAALIGGVAVPYAIFTAGHPGADRTRGPVGAANRLNDDYAFAVSRSLDIYNHNLAGSRWTDLTWNGAIDERADFSESRRTLAFAEHLSAEALADFERQAADHEAQLRTLLAERHIPAETAGQVLAQSRQQDATYRAMIRLDGEQLVAFTAVVDVLEAWRGRWRVENGKYVFGDATAKAAFDRALQRFVAAAQAREALNAPPA